MDVVNEIVVDRETHILVSDAGPALFPADNLYPSNDLYPKEATMVSNIVENTMDLDELLYEGDLKFGQLCATKFELTVYDTPNIAGKYLSVYQRDGNTFHQVFTGIVESSKLDRLGTDRQVVAYDYAYNKSRINVATWWTNFWNTRQSATLKQLRESLLEYVNIQFEHVTLINDDAVLTKTVNISSIAFNEMLKMICELSCVFPHFNRAGELMFYMLETEQAPHNLELANEGSLYEGENSTWEDYTKNAFTGIQFYGNSSDLVYTEGNSANPYTIQENILLYGMTQEQLHTIGANMLDYISEVEYKPCNIKMIISNFDYRLGDRISTTHGTAYIVHNAFSGPQLIEQTLEQTGSESSEEVVVETSISDLISDTKREEMNSDIEDINGDIEDINEDIGDINEDIGDINEDIGQINVSLQKNEQGLQAEVTRATGAEEAISASLELKIDKDDDGTIVSLINGSADRINFTARNMFTVDAPNLEIDANGNVTAKNFIAKDKIQMLFGSTVVDAITKVYGTNSTPLFNGDITGHAISAVTASKAETADTASYAYRAATADEAQSVTGRIGLSNLPDDVKTSATTNYSTDGSKHTQFIYNFSGSSGHTIVGQQQLVDVSDERLKENIKPLQSEIKDAYLELEPITFNFKKDLRGYDLDLQYGFSAQKTKEVFEKHNIEQDFVWECCPEEVTEYDKKYITDGKKLALQKDQLHAMHVYMIQEQQKEIDSLKQEINELKNLLKEKGVI